MVRKKMRFGSALNLQNQARVQAGARFQVFNHSQKKLYFGVALDSHFGVFGNSIRRKQSFQGCLKIAWFLNRFLVHFGPPKMDQKSMKNRSSGSSWAKMAPRRCHLEPTWLQEPVFEGFVNRFFDQFRLMSDLLWADICSLQEPFFSHFLNRFWIILG